MTVKELKNKLETYPEHMEVLIEDTDGEFQFKPLEEMEVKNVKFSEGHEGEPFAFEDCLVLGEENI